MSKQLFDFNLEKRINEAPVAVGLNNVIEEMERRDKVAWLKDTYSKKYLLKNNLVTRKEYRTIPAESVEREKEYKRLQGIASLMHQVVGAEA